MTVATTTTMARAAPRIAERTGTALVAPGIEREPHAGDARHRTGRSGRAAASRRATAWRGGPTSRAGAGPAGRRCTTAERNSTTMRPATPMPSTVQSNAMPRDGYTRRTGPNGDNGDRATARTAPPTAPRRRWRRRPRSTRRPWSWPDRLRAPATCRGRRRRRGAGDRSPGRRSAARRAPRSRRTRRARSTAAGWRVRPSPPRPR